MPLVCPFAKDSRRACGLVTGSRGKHMVKLTQQEIQEEALKIAKRAVIKALNEQGQDVFNYSPNNIAKAAQEVINSKDGSKFLALAKKELQRIHSH